MPNSLVNFTIVSAVTLFCYRASTTMRTRCRPWWRPRCWRRRGRRPRRRTCLMTSGPRLDRWSWWCLTTSRIDIYFAGRFGEEEEESTSDCRLNTLLCFFTRLRHNLKSIRNFFAFSKGEDLSLVKYGFKSLYIFLNDKICTVIDIDKFKACFVLWLSQWLALSKYLLCDCATWLFFSKINLFKAKNYLFDVKPYKHLSWHLLFPVLSFLASLTN